MRALNSSIYKDIVATFPVGVLLVDGEGVICEWNTWLTSLTEITKEQALGKQLHDLFPRINTKRFQFAIEQVLQHRHPQILSQALNHYLIPIPLKQASEGDSMAYMQQAVSLFPIIEGENNYALVVISDVTDNCNQKNSLLRVAKRFEEESIHDELTGAYNRRFLWEYLDIELAKALRGKYTLVCTVYDLDHFKEVNDNLGHEAGDEVLRSFVTLIEATLRIEDKCFRYGGEEFIVITSQKDASQMDVLADRIRLKMAQKKSMVYSNMW